MKEDQIIGGTDGDGNPEFVEDLPIHPITKELYAYITTLQPEDMRNFKLLADKLNEKVHEFDEICSFREQSL